MLEISCHYKQTIDKAVSLLVSRENDFIKHIDSSYIFEIKNEVGHLITMDLFEATEIFEQEVSILKTVTDIERAIIVSVPPGCRIPVHLDDDDPRFRLLTGIHCPSNTNLQFNQTTVHMTQFETLGFPAFAVEHGGVNNSDQYWNMITMSVSGYNQLPVDVYKIRC
jgi:hypothetical protein